ncbi:MAG: NAD(P)H-hydrate dehydratase [Burkholderiales bacterium]|nr:NAD(P)H-hydrate dehydratase [Burkholderiales bacterium]
MQRVLPPPRSLALFGALNTREIERRAAAALPPHTLMRRAGLAVGRLALAIAPHAQRVWICAGPGNNGGDGLEAAMHLAGTGKRVSVTLLGDASRLPDDARDAYVLAQAAGIAIVDALDVPTGFDDEDLIIDALLGLGASRPPEGAIAECIARMNALSGRTLAIDAPSGLNCGTGQPLGASAVQATHTLSLLTLKPGLFTARGRDLAGEVWFDDLGVGLQDDSPDAFLIGADQAAATPRAHAQHKGSFGDVAVVGGARSMSGAALLAARAALAAGAGRVYASLLDEQAPAHDVLRPELMFRAHWWQSHHDVIAATTAVCGCGGGDAVREPLPRLLSASARLVVDADALNAIASDASLQALLRARADRGRPTIITPHPLEAARLLGTDTGQVQADRLTAAQTLTERFRCVVLLKGSGTVIAARGATPRINSSGNAALATAGTGDVLAGWIGGLWAQQSKREPLAIACAAAYAHGAAADAFGGSTLLASDLIKAMRRS